MPRVSSKNAVQTFAGFLINIHRTPKTIFCSFFEYFLLRWWVIVLFLFIQKVWGENRLRGANKAAAILKIGRFDTIDAADIISSASAVIFRVTLRPFFGGHVLLFHKKQSVLRGR